ncbi:hypothetical protein [Aliiruegeria sabulilitoris]|uniref:hypothetical protein n=1 Tax=Aliiruegeria sabulilitoris TaxID=1510458 RepID=UPI0012E33830|nr:hypothetical protein [Aliiruegeria sabulilitoris]NDR57932.1 hypothetical protein [Pseudoruegeria sp. M32A2M]
MTAFSGYVAYRVYDGPDLTFDIAGGFRAFGMDIDTKLDGNLRPSEHASQSASWVDPLIAARLTVPFGGNWFATATADVGGFITQASSTWQAIGLVGYRFNAAWSAEFGYRYMNVQKEISGNEVQLGLGGPVIGATYRF